MHFILCHSCDKHRSLLSCSYRLPIQITVTFRLILTTISEARNWHKDIFKQVARSGLEKENVPICCINRPWEQNFSCLALNHPNMSPGKNKRFTILIFRPTFKCPNTTKESRHLPIRKIYHLGIFWKYYLQTFIDQNVAQNITAQSQSHVTIMVFQILKEWKRKIRKIWLNIHYKVWWSFCYRDDLWNIETLINLWQFKKKLKNT